MYFETDPVQWNKWPKDSSMLYPGAHCLRGHEVSGAYCFGVCCLRGGLSPGHVVSRGRLSLGRIISRQVVSGHIVPPLAFVHTTIASAFSSLFIEHFSQTQSLPKLNTLDLSLDVFIFLRLPLE